MGNGILGGVLVIWFVEERDVFGRWQACLYHGAKPTRQRIGHSVEFRADPVPVWPILHGLTVAQVASFMSPDGEFYGIESPETLVDFLRDPQAEMIVVRA